MDVLSERQPHRGTHCGMKDALTIQTLEEVRDEAPEPSPRRSAKKTNVGTQANSATETEAETKSAGISAMESEYLPETRDPEVEASLETRFGEAFAMEVEAPPEAKFGKASAKDKKAPLMTTFGGAVATEPEAPTEIEFGEHSAKEIQSPLELKSGEASAKDTNTPLMTTFRDAVVTKPEAPTEIEFGEHSAKAIQSSLEVKFTGASAMECDTHPGNTYSSRSVSGDFKEDIPQGEVVEDFLSSQIVPGDSKKIASSEEEKAKEEKEEPLDQSLSQSDINRITECKAIIGEASSSASLDPKLILKDGSSSAPLDLKLTLKKEKSSASLDSKRPPKKESSSGSLDSNLPPGVMRRRNRVSVTVLERMQQDPLLAEHFAQLETPSAEPISEFSTHGIEPRRSLKSTSRLKCTTDSVGIKYMNQYIVIKVLGRGTFGKVKLCLNTMDCKLYAVKILHRKWVARRSIVGTRDDVGKGAMREIAIMKKLNHPNVVALFEVIDDPSDRKLYLVLEYVEGGPLMDNNLWQPIPEDKARLYFRDMCQGLDYLHFNKIVHRDLKPGNLLRTMDGRIKISDFGVSHMLDHESDSIHGAAGTPAFLAPELCLGGECQGAAADIWALGVCLYVMVYGEIPFPAETVADMYKCIIDKKLAFSKKKIRLSKSLRNLLSLILTKDPASRISLVGIMQHDWVSNEGIEPLIPFKFQKNRISTATAVSEADVKAAVKQVGLAALSNVEPVEKHFEPGEYIMRQGEEGNEMYLINSGECEVLVESRSLTQPSRGRMEYAIAERGPGQYIGEMALSTDITKKPPKRTASIRAKTHVVTLVVSRDQVMEVLSKNSEAAKSIADTIAERDQEMRRRMRALELRLPSFRPSSFTNTNEPESTKVAILEQSMPSTSPERDEDVTKGANTCLGCRIF